MMKTKECPPIVMMKVVNGILQHPDPRYCWPAIDGNEEKVCPNLTGKSDLVLPDGEYPSNGFEKVTQHDDSKNVWVQCPIDIQDAIRQGWPIRPTYYFFKENLTTPEPKTIYLRPENLCEAKKQQPELLPIKAPVNADDLENFTFTFDKDDRDFLVDALNSYWDHAMAKSTFDKNLSERGKENLEEIIVNSKKMMKRLDPTIF